MELLDQTTELDALIQAGIQETKDVKPLTYMDEVKIRSHIRAAEIETGLRPKTFWETMEGSAVNALGSSLTVPTATWKQVGRKLASFSRENNFEEMYSPKAAEEYKKHSIEHQSLIDNAVKRMSSGQSTWKDERPKIDKHKEEFVARQAAQKKEAYDKYLDETSLAVDVPDSMWAKVFNQPLEDIRANLASLYETRPDLANEEIEGIADLIKNPRKLVGAVVESVPVLVEAGIMTATGHPHLAFALMFAAEGSEAYDEAIADGATEEQASKAFEIYGLAAAALEYVQVKQGLRFLKTLGKHASAKEARKAVTAQVARKIARRGEKSMTRQWLELAVAEAGEEMAQGQTQEWVAKAVYGKEQQDGFIGWVNRRGIEAMIAFGMSAPLGLPAVGIDVKGGQRRRTAESVDIDRRTMHQVAKQIGFDTNDYNIPEVLSRNHRNIASYIEGVFGKRVTWYVPLTDKATPYNGWASPEDTSTILLNAAMPDPMKSVALHELTHQIEVEDPQAYAELEDTVLTALNDREAVEADIRSKYQEVGSVIDDKGLRSEIVAEAIGRLAQDQNFLEKVAGDAPNAVTRFQRKLLRTLRSAIRRKRTKTRQADEKIQWMDPFITDMAELSDRIAIALHMYGLKAPVLSAEESLYANQIRDMPVGQEKPFVGPPRGTEQPSKKTLALPPGKLRKARKQPQEAGPSKTPIALGPAPERPSEAKPEAKKEIETKKTEIAVSRETPEKEVAIGDSGVFQGRSKTATGTVTRKFKNAIVVATSEGEEIKVFTPVKKIGEAQPVPVIKPEGQIQQEDFFAKKLKAAEELAERQKKMIEAPPTTKAQKGVELAKMEQLQHEVVRKEPLPIPVMVKNWLQNQAIRGVSENTVKAYADVMKSFIGFISSLKITDANDITKDLMRRYIRGLTNKGNKASTINQRLRILNEVFKLMSEEKLIGENPIDSDMYLKEAQTLPKAKPFPTMKAIISKVDKEKDRNALRDIALLHFMLDTGARRAEVSGLALERVSETAKKATVTGKGEKERIVPFSEETAKAIAEYIEKERPNIRGSEKSPYVFLGTRGEPLSGDAIFKIVKKYSERAGVKLSPHVFRHSMATEMLKRGVNLEALRIMLGHASLDTTQQYLKTAITSLQQQVKEHHPRPSLARLPYSHQRLLDTSKTVTNLKEGLQYAENKEIQRKGWILSDGSVLPVERIKIGQNYSWEHSDHARAAGATIRQLVSAGVIRISRYHTPNRQTVIQFELNPEKLTPKQIEAMKEFAQRSVSPAERNDITVHAKSSKAIEGYGIAQLTGISEARGALDTALKMALAQVTGRPSIVRSMTIKQAIHATTGVRQQATQIREMTEKQLLKFRLKAEQKAAKSAYHAGWRDMGVKLNELKDKYKKYHEIRRSLIQWVKDEIPPAYRGRMLVSINNARSERTVQKAVERLSREIEDVIKREQMARLKKFVRRFKKKYGYRRSGIYKEGAQFKMAPEFSKVFEKLFEAISFRGQRTEEEVLSLKELIEYVQTEKTNAEAQLTAGQTTEDNFYLVNEIIPTLQHLEGELAKQSVSKFDADTLRELTDSLETLVAQWEWQHNEDPESFNAMNRTDMIVNKVNIIAEVVNGWKRPIEADKRNVQTAQSPYRFKRLWTGVFGRFNYNLATMSYVVSGAQKGTLYQMFGPTLGHSRDTQKGTVFMIQDFVRDEMKKAGITDYDLKTWSRPVQVRGMTLPKPAEDFISRVAPEVIKDYVEKPGLEELSITLASGKTIRMTVGEALNIVMQARGNEFQYKALLKSGVIFRDMPNQKFSLTPNDLQLIRDSLPEKAQKMATILGLGVNLMNEAINETSLEIDGYQKANVDSYWHIRRYKERDAQGREQQYTFETIESRSHWKQRTGGTAPIVVVDALNEFVDTVQTGAEYVGLAFHVRRLRTILNDPTIRNIVREKGYEDYWNDMVTQVNAIQDRKAEADWVTSWYGKWITSVTRAIFAFNLRVAGQQYASVFLALPDFGVRGIKAIRVKPDKKLEERIKKWSSFLRERFEGHVNRELGDAAMSGGTARFYTGKDQLINHPSFLVMYFDKMAIMDVWRMAEAKTMENPKYKGRKPEDLYNDRTFMESAMYLAEESIRKTQPTWDVVDRSVIGSKRNPFVRSVTLFHSQREKLAQMLGVANSEYTNALYQIQQRQGLSSLREAARTKEGLKAAGKAALEYGSVIANLGLVKLWGLLYTMYVYGKPEEDPFEEWATSVVADIPGMYYFGDIGGEVITALSRKMRDKPIRQLGAYELPPYRVLSAARQAAYESGKMVLMTVGPENYTDAEVRKQLATMLDKQWEAANYGLGLPFLHLTTLTKMRLRNE
jgi:integrase/recombinase XerC